MAPQARSNRSQLIFEDGRFAIYLREGVANAESTEGAGALREPTVLLQVCVREAIRSDQITFQFLHDHPRAEADVAAMSADAPGASGPRADAATPTFSADGLAKLTRDPADAMAEVAVTGEDEVDPALEGLGCWYLGGDPEQESVHGDCSISIATEGLKLEMAPNGKSDVISSESAWGFVMNPASQQNVLSEEVRRELANEVIAATFMEDCRQGLNAEVVSLVDAAEDRAPPSGCLEDTIESTPTARPGYLYLGVDGETPTKTSCKFESHKEPAPDSSVASAAVVEAGDDPSLSGHGCWYLSEEATAGDAKGPLKEEKFPRPEPQSAPAEERLACGGQAELTHLSSSKVEWCIHGISAKMKAHAKGCRIFSPNFDAFGISQLSLVFYPNGNSNAKQGFCSLGLKAPHGSHLRYKLYTGKTERFTDLRHNVTESWGFVDMCKVQDELELDTDTLRLGVEIVDNIDANETLTTSGSTKVEWILGNLQNKLLHYQKDVALYSEEFSVGGVDRLRLKFYPSGKKEADVGWCSLYLEAPRGSELRCRLSVGKKSMSFDRLEKFGEDSIWGFLTLCRLQDELESDKDSVRIGLEVLETKRLDGRLSESEDAYLKTLNSERRSWLLGELDRVEKLRNGGDAGIPSRFRILQLDIPDAAKAVALSKWDSMQSDMMSGETSKIKKWIDGLLTVPFGSFKKPLVSMDEGLVKVQASLDKARKSLNEAVYGHEEPKQKIVQILCQWIANPHSMSLVLGIQGPPGNGKTTLCRRGIAEALDRPFMQISLGGATDASVLEGHSYTYVGSTWGRIAGLLMEAKCMNPVIFFDELDKVSDTPRGEEIIGVLTHLTDHSQNKTFADRYFEGVPLDLSRALFIFSFNDESKLNTVLKDRLTVINTDGFDQTAKLKIAREYLMPELLANVGLKKGDVDLGREELQYLCQRCGVSMDEGGVRGVKQALESVILHLNEIRMTQQMEEAAVGKADDGKADDGNTADAEHRADGAQRSEQEAQEPSRTTNTAEREGEAQEQGKKKRKIPKVTLPVMLTRDLIDQLVTQSRSKRNDMAMMYI